jgi:hypothetical protein
MAPPLPRPGRLAPAGLSCALLASLALVAPPSALARPSATAAPAAALLTLPAPGGPFAVGMHADAVPDPTRIDEATGAARSIPIRVWYPAARGASGPAAPYLSPAIQAWAEDRLGVPGLFAIDTHAITDAPARRQVRGIVLVQPGGGSLAAFQTGQVIDLASRGYAVVTMDHPHESIVVEAADGSLIEGPGEAEGLALDERLVDGAVVLDDLRRLVPQARRDAAVGMFGHSRGGAATAELMAHDERVDAGVALDIATMLFGDDVNPPGDVVAAGLDRPLGLMCSLVQPCDTPFLVDFVTRLRAASPTHTLPVQHDGYTDLAVFEPEAQRADPAVGELLAGIWNTGTRDSLRAGERALDAQRRFLARFFDRHLAQAVR